MHAWTRSCVAFRALGFRTHQTSRCVLSAPAHDTTRPHARYVCPAASGMCQVTVCRLLCSGCDARGSCGARHEHSAAAAVLFARDARRQGTSSCGATRTAPSASRSVCPSAARPNIVRQAGEHVVLHGCTATVHDHDEIQGCASVSQATTDGGGARIRLRGWQFGWGGQGRCHS